MKPTEDMKRDARIALRQAGMDDNEARIAEVALEAALAPFEAPPFVLDDEGARALDNHFMAPELRLDFLEREVRRALRVLGVAQAAPVSDYQRGRQEVWEEFSRAADWHGIVHEETGEQLFVSRQAPPFVMSDVERYADKVAQRQGEDGQVNSESVRALQDALRRACKTIGVAQAEPEPEPEPLSHKMRRHAEFWARDMGIPGDIAKELLARCPKPAPAVKSNEELRNILADSHAWTDAESDAIAELVRRANGAKP